VRNVSLDSDHVRINISRRFIVNQSVEMNTVVTEVIFHVGHVELTDSERD
jgi:hypothetical protein